MPDPLSDPLADLVSTEPTAQERMQAMIAALRGQSAFGQLGQLTGDRVLAPLGHNLDQSAQQGIAQIQALPLQQARTQLEQQQALAARQKNEALANPSTGKMFRQALSKFGFGDVPDDTPASVMEQMIPTAEKAFNAETTADWRKQNAQMAADARRAALQPKIEAKAQADSEADAIAQAIMEGSQPPDLSRLYGKGASVRAKLAQNGFDLTRAVGDWQATQRHLATLNGPAQERARQAVANAEGQLGNVEDLYNEWLRVGPASGFRALNRAALAAAKQMGGETGAIAQNLEGQVQLLAGELGNALMGGNSPTDHALKMAQTMLSGDWNEATFKKAIETLRRDLKIRHNSMMTSQAAGVSPGSPYAPPGVQQQGPGAAGAAPGGGGDPAAAKARAALQPGERLVKGPDGYHGWAPGPGEKLPPGYVEVP